MTNEEQSKQTETEAIDWLYCALGAAIIAALVLAAVFGHSAVSVAYGQGDPMPILQVEHFLPSVSK